MEPRIVRQEQYPSYLFEADEVAQGSALALTEVEGYLAHEKANHAVSQTC
jgi:hypothetical protein